MKANPEEFTATYIDSGMTFYVNKNGRIPIQCIADYCKSQRINMTTPWIRLTSRNNGQYWTMRVNDKPYIEFNFNTRER